MDVHLIDGTYELFRHFFAVPTATDTNDQEIGAVRGVLNSVLSMIEGGAEGRTLVTRLNTRYYAGSVGFTATCR